MPAVLLKARKKVAWNTATENSTNSCSFAAATCSKEWLLTGVLQQLCLQESEVCQQSNHSSKRGRMETDEYHHCNKPKKATHIRTSTQREVSFKASTRAQSRFNELHDGSALEHANDSIRPSKTGCLNGSIQCRRTRRKNGIS